MNILCHLVLGDGCPQRMLGQFLGDFTRGDVDRLPCGPAVRAGIRAHRRADAFSDCHAFTRAAKQALPPHLRRYGGVVLDVFCDYLLHSCWADTVPAPKAKVLHRAYTVLAAPPEPLPPPARRFADLILRYKLLDAYADPAEIRGVLRRMSQRLRRPADLSLLLPVYLEMETELRQGFPAFFHDTAAAIQTS